MLVGHLQLPVHRFELGALLLDLAEQAHVLDGDDSLIRESGDQANL